MNTYKICRVEHYHVFYSVEAESPEEALQMVYRGEAQAKGHHCSFAATEYCLEEGGEE